MKQSLQKPDLSVARALIYLRVSTDEQAAHGAGLDAQLDQCIKHADRLGMAWCGPWRDEGISGAAPLDRRPGLLEATGRLVAGDVLLVAKRDRLGRDPIVVAMVEAGALRVGARVVSAAGEGTDGDGPTDILMRRIIDAFAEFERLMIKGRTRAALQSLRGRGRVYSPIPYGYRAEDDGQGTKTSRGRNPGRLVEDLDEQSFIAAIRRMHDAGQSARRIAENLDELGVPTRHGRPWCHQSVRAILARSPSST